MPGPLRAPPRPGAVGPVLASARVPVPPPMGRRRSRALAAGRGDHGDGPLLRPAGDRLDRWLGQFRHRRAGRRRAGAQLVAASAVLAGHPDRPGVPWGGTSTRCLEQMVIDVEVYRMCRRLHEGIGAGVGETDVLGALDEVGPMWTSWPGPDPGRGPRWRVSSCPGSGTTPPSTLGGSRRPDWRARHGELMTAMAGPGILFRRGGRGPGAPGARSRSSCGCGPARERAMRYEAALLSAASRRACTRRLCGSWPTRHHGSRRCRAARPRSGGRGAAGGLARDSSGGAGTRRATARSRGPTAGPAGVAPLPWRPPGAQDAREGGASPCTAPSLVCIPRPVARMT